MQNNVVFFKDLEKDDTSIKFVSYGNVVEFTAEKDKSVSVKNRRFILHGLNHLLEWAYNNEKISFLNKFTLFIVYLKNRLTSHKFYSDVEEALKLAVGKNEIENIKGDLYSDIFSNIDKEIIYTIMEYIDYNITYEDKAGNTVNYSTLIYNSPKVNNSSDELTPQLDDIDLFSLSVIITLSKLITLGSILLGKGKLTSFTVKAIMEIASRVSDPVIGDYLYNKNDKRYGELTKNGTSKSDVFDNVYVYMRDIILREHLSKNIPTAELVEVNGKSQDALIKEIIDYSLSVIYKVNPIETSNEDTGSPYEMEGDYRNYGFTARSIVSYIKKIIKENHNYKNKKVKHPNVVKIKKVINDNSASVGSYHKQELILEKRDAADLARRKDNVRILSNYIENYLEKNEINIEDYNIKKTPLCDYFIIKLLYEISEDYLTLKIINLKTYNLLVVYIAHIIQEKYLYLSFALKAKNIIERVLFPNDIEKFENLLPQLRGYHLDPIKYKESFFTMISNDYQYVSPNSKSIQIINIDNELFNFIKDDEQNTFEFIEGYIYDYE